MANKFKTREEWLTFVTDELRPAYKKVGAPIPTKVRFSIGYTVRLAARWLALGAPICGHIEDHGRLVCEGFDAENDE